MQLNVRIIRSGHVHVHTRAWAIYLAPTAATAPAAAGGRFAHPVVGRTQATTSSGGSTAPDGDSNTGSSQGAPSSPQQEVGQPHSTSLPQPIAEQSSGQQLQQPDQPTAQDAPPQLDAAAVQSSSDVLPAAGAAAGGGFSGSLGGVQESSGAGAAVVGGGGTSGGGPSAVTLLSRFNGVGYTFVLAGFLKIMTVGGLSLSAPTDVARTAFGKATPYLMVPVGLAMCWAAKTIVDTGLHESKRFLQYLVAGLVIAYFVLVKLMYKYEPQTDWVRRPRPRMPGQMAELRSQLGDRELLAGAGDLDSARYYEAEKPGSRELYDDVAWYEGRYPSALAAPGQQAKRGTSRRAALAVTDTEEEYSVAANDGRQRFRTGGAVEPTSGSSRSFLGNSNR